MLRKNLVLNDVKNVEVFPLPFGEKKVDKFCFIPILILVVGRVSLHRTWVGEQPDAFLLR